MAGWAMEHGCHLSIQVEGSGLVGKRSEELSTRSDRKGPPENSLQKDLQNIDDGTTLIA